MTEFEQEPDPIQAITQALRETEKRLSSDVRSTGRELVSGWVSAIDRAKSIRQLGEQLKKHGDELLAMANTQAEGMSLLSERLGKVHADLTGALDKGIATVAEKVDGASAALDSRLGMIDDKLTNVPKKADLQIIDAKLEKVPEKADLLEIGNGIYDKFQASVGDFKELKGSIDSHKAWVIGIGVAIVGGLLALVFSLR